jgi:hypothetical protein
VAGINIPYPQHWFSDGKFRIRGRDKHPGSAALPVFTLNKRSLCLQVIGALSDRQFANSLRGVQEQLGQFNAYRCVKSVG